MGYEFLRWLGFRELTKRKLICEEPDFDVVATAITSINAKLTLLEKNKPLPIIPDHRHMHRHYHQNNHLPPQPKAMKELRLDGKAKSAPSHRDCHYDEEDDDEKNEQLKQTKDDKIESVQGRDRKFSAI